MGTAHPENGTTGVRLVDEPDGRVTAVHTETGVASFGESEEEALVMLAEALAVHKGGDQPVTESDLEEFGLSSEDIRDDPVPSFME